MKLDSWKPDDLDLVRALLCALSWREQDALTPVSSVAIYHELLRRDRHFSAADALATLSLIGDAQRLEHGYWLPSPTHGATDGHIVVIVSGQSTPELVGACGPAIRIGDHGRYLISANELRLRLALVPLCQWLDTPKSSVQWLRDYLASASFVPPFHLDDVEVYRHWRDSLGRRWLPLSEGLRSGERNILARLGSSGATRYFLLRIARGVLVGFHELPVGFDIARAMCALHTISGDPILALLRTDSAQPNLSLSCPIVPAKERIYLQCVGVRHAGDELSPDETRLPLEARPDIERLFTALGCNVQEKLA